MDRETMKTQMKQFKTKARAARKEGKTDAAAAFQNRVSWCARQLRATAPRAVKKAEG